MEENNVMATEQQVYDICLKEIDKKSRRLPLNGDKMCTKQKAIKNFRASEIALGAYQDNQIIKQSDVKYYQGYTLPAINILLYSERLQDLMSANQHGLGIHVTTSWKPNTEKTVILNVNYQYVATKYQYADIYGKSVIGNPYLTSYNLDPGYLAVTNIPFSFDFGGYENGWAIPHPGQNIPIFDDIETEYPFTIKIQIFGSDTNQDITNYFMSDNGQWISEEAEYSSANLISFSDCDKDRISIYNSKETKDYFDAFNLTECQ